MVLRAVEVAAALRRPRDHLELAALGLQDEECMQAQLDPTAWPAMRARLEETFASKPRDEVAAARARASAGPPVPRPLEHLC